MVKYTFYGKNNKTYSILDSKEESLSNSNCENYIILSMMVYKENKKLNGKEIKIKIRCAEEDIKNLKGLDK